MLSSRSVNNLTARKDDEKTFFAAMYARTSSPNQRFNYSIPEQINQCWKFCRDRAWNVRYVFVDECQSGGSVERPKFQLMLENAKAGKFQVIVFWKLDRFCRSLVDLVNVEKSLRQWGVGLCSITEFIDTTTSVGRFNYRNLASVAELERELIGERARLGLYGLAKDHKWPNPHPPIGYERSSDGRLGTKEDEARLVRRIFEMYLQEKSMPQVAFQLNKERILTKKGKKWNAVAVKDVLTDGIYVGIFNVAGVKDYVEEYRILEDGLFVMANETRLRYRRKGSHRPPMPEDRKMTKINKMFCMYFDLLKEAKE